MQMEPNVVFKRGSRVKPNEEKALRLINKHAPLVPAPQVYYAHYREINGVQVGQIFMTFVPGKCLESVWDHLDDATKERICHNIWSLIYKIRDVPRPEHLDGPFYCTADGSPSLDRLLSQSEDSAPPFPDDAALRNRIFSLYVKCNGLSYADGKDLPDMLPRSDNYVFIHGDIAPRNIMVDEKCQISGLIDWENAGWFPDYWEYANIIRPSPDRDWRDWMERTKPASWDITGIIKARRVLF